MVGAGLWLKNTQDNQQEEVTLQRIITLKQNRKFDECVSAAQKIKEDSRIFSKAQSLLSECQTTISLITLAEAIKLAKGKRFTEAIAIVQKIPADSPEGKMAQQLSKEWDTPKPKPYSPRPRPKPGPIVIRTPAPPIIVKPKRSHPLPPRPLPKPPNSCNTPQLPLEEAERLGCS
jgi:hypothetical protein